MSLELAQKVVDQLNRLLAADKKLLETMVENRLPVSEGYKSLDEFVYMDDSDGKPASAGLVGVLNGILSLGIDGTSVGRIAAVYSDDEATNLTGFTVIQPKAK